MLSPVTLFQHTDEEIKISVQAYFEGEVLVIDGYDVGPKVAEFWGDSDYEYQVRIFPEGVAFVYQFLGVETGNKQALLIALANRFNSNTCYSDIRNLIEENKLPSEGFSWA